MSDIKRVDESHHIPSKKRNVTLRREVWVDKQGKVCRYNLAYINHQLFNEDNGRVIGFDNAHGYHHKHYYGKVEAVAFTNFEEIEAQFEAEWLAVRRK